MHQPINIRLFEVALGLFFGVLFGHYYSMPIPESEQMYLPIGLIVTLSYLISVNSRPRLWWISRLWFFMIWIALGCVHYTNQRPNECSSKKPINQLGPHTPNIVSSDIVKIPQHLPDQKKLQLNAIQLQYRLKPWGKTNRYMAHFHNPRTRTSYPVVLLTRDSVLAHLLSPDQTLWTHIQAEVIKNPKNQGGFDAKAYYHSQGIERSIELSSDQVYCWSQHPLSLRAKAQKINDELAQYWRQAPISQKAKALALAIILGQTEDLTPDVKTQFANAGALHVLALSGLHVGLVVLLLQWIFRPLKYLPYGHGIQAMALLVLLWGYALICGLSPSITRAVCMYSVWQIGQIIGRPISGSNSVLLTFILLLWWSPYWLFSVGFQLSFTAVMALTYIPSRVQKIWRPRNRIFRYLMQLTVVGIAAQVGVGPLSVYYFHQFPLLFWLSNLIAIPLMTPILVLGLIITFSHILLPLPQIIYHMWSQLVHLILSSVQWISGHNHLIVDRLNLPSIALYSYYIIILLLWWGLQHPWLSQRSLLRVVLPYSCSILLMALISLEISQKKTTPEFALLHQYGSSVMLVRTAEGYVGLSNNDQQHSKLWLNWTRHYNVPLSGEKKLPRIMSLASRPVIVVDSLGIYPPIIDGIVILTDNANIHFETMVNEIKPYLILADGSNYKQVVARWRSRATELDQKFLDTYRLGAIETHDALFKNYF